MKLINPYRNEGTWLRGSLHIHSNFSKCGWHSIPEVALAYRDYDFVAVTDHDRITTETEQLQNHVIFRGFEVSGARHMLLVEMPLSMGQQLDNTFSVSHYSELARQTVENGGLAVINHPTRLAGQHWSDEEILSMEHVDGLEIFSGDGIHVEEDTAFPLWDKMLSAGKRLWGFGNDDFHHWGQERRVWNVVNAAEHSKQSILDALRRGDFYVSSGYGFDSIQTQGDTITFHLKGGSPLFENAYKYLTLFGENGHVLAEKTGRFMEFSYKALGNEGYIRAEVYMSGGYGGFSQPIFIEE